MRNNYKSKAYAIYCFSYALSSKTGKRKATSEKIEAFSRIFNSRLDVISPNKDSNVLDFIITEIKLVNSIIFNKPKFLILRGPVGIIGSFLAKGLGISIIREIHANNYEEIAEKLNLIINDYDQYNSDLDEERNKLFYKKEEGKLSSELNKIFNGVKL